MNQNNRQRNTLVNLNALDSIVLSSTPAVRIILWWKYDYDNNGQPDCSMKKLNMIC